MVLAFIPSLGTAISSARPEEGGLASGIVNTSYQVGSALGLAAMTAVATAHGAGQIANPDALTNGFSAAFLGAAGIAAVGAFLVALTLRDPRQPAPVEPLTSSSGGRAQRAPAIP
jgi:MFS family permease